MDLLKDKIKTVYFKYLSVAFGSALISSIYGIVDMAVVGQYQGPEGTAALAVVAPIWNIIYSLGLLMGIGGSVLYGTSKGRNEKVRQNEYFTTAFMGTLIFAIMSWLVVGFFESSLLTLFGADKALLSLSQSYLLPIKFVLPLFLFNQMLAAFLRNDNAPSLAAIAVLAGGIFNVFGDLFFVFGLNMGMMGAGLATAMGACITCVMMVSHFFTPKNTLKLVKPTAWIEKLAQISITGMSTFVVDVAMGILTMLFNRQIIRYLGTDALAVYGILVNISTVVQCCAYSVGQAAQPLISINYGAKQWTRIQQTLKYSLYAACAFSLVWTAAVGLVPNAFVRLFMNPTQEIYAIAPMILRRYALSFLLLPLNIFSTFYFQSLMKPMASIVISIARGVVISGGLILLLPTIAGANAIWYAMPITEMITAVFTIILMLNYTKQMVSQPNLKPIQVK